VGYGEWGIVDTWRRKKPEFWNTKKAYSPTKIYQNHITDFVPGEVLIIPVHNRFDHTNFSELKIEWKYGSYEGLITNCYLEPHAKGELTIPAQQWNGSESLHLSFFQNDTILVDRYMIQLGPKKDNLPTLGKASLTLSETDDIMEFAGESITYKVNKNTGLFEEISKKGTTIIRNGPYINLRIPAKKGKSQTYYEMHDYYKNWKLTGFKYALEEGIARIDLSGEYDSIKASFSISFDGTGNMDVGYQIFDAPVGQPIQESGIVFNTTGDFSKLTWDRDAFFSGLPEDHLGGTSGNADLTVKTLMNYRKRPYHEWELDRQNFYYHGLNTVLTYTNVARGMKENIRNYSLQTNKDVGITVVSDGTQAVRFDHIKGKYRLFVNDLWDYPSLGWGNYVKEIKTERESKGSVKLVFN
jgi:hypothetical protein